jgi:hypothetical protein
MWFGLVCAQIPTFAAIVINEIHYNPDIATEPAEFVELLNTGASTVNLAGWRLSDDGNLNFTFPATNVAPGGFVVVAQNPAFLQTKFGATGALGPFRTNNSSALSKEGEKLTLRDSGGSVQDEVEYKLGFPWPTVGDATIPGNGNSIELIHPSLDNDLGGSWRAAGSGAGGTPIQNTTLLAAQSAWKYVKGTNEASSPTTAWRQPGFNDAAWSIGTLPIGYGEAFITTPLNDMRSNYVSVFLRKQFTVTDPSQFTRLVLEAQYDDGFKVWLNGSLVVDSSANMPTGEVAYNGLAVQTFETATFANVNLSGNALSLLVPGLNTIAVQAHNVNRDTSSDFFFDARLIGQVGGSGGAGPSPGRINTVYSTNTPPQIRQVEHTPEQPTAGQIVAISAKVTDPDGVGSVSLQYQIVNPGSYIELTDSAYTNAANWVTLSMNDSGTAGDVTAGDDVFTAQIPASVQTHRRLIRYRITVTDAGNRSVRVPYVDDPQPNFAYFVYNGVPEWRGAVQPGAGGANGAFATFSSNVMGRLPVFHLIGKSNMIATATWFSRYGGDLYQWQGALVYDGKVLDHIRYRARGGVWRYSMCKNMWKFDLNRGHDIEMRDNWGRKYKVPWTKLNLGASIQQGDFNHRGEQGMFESLGFRLFNIVGVAAPHTTFCTFRVIDDPQEASATTQYEGDFWGVYLAIEQENGRFLEEHDLPDGNLYKMEGGTGELNNLGPLGPTDKSDLTYLQANYTGASEQWWRTNWNVARHYSYQAIVQGIHHYDIADGKNYFFYRNPETHLWETCTWDLDLTWADNMYRSGQTGGGEPLKSRLLDDFSNPGRLPNINVEFRNRIREIRDLLWNSDQAFKLVDEYAALLRGPTNGPTILDADRSMWDYNPKMISSTYTDNPSSKAGHGRFYQWPNEPTVSKNFNGCIQLLKNYIGYRATNATFSLDTMAADNSKPNRPTITYTGPAGYPLNRLTFQSSPYGGANSFRSMRWRVGEITDTNSPNYRSDEPHRYEIETVWDSGPITTFNATIQIPANVLRVGSRYRVRVLHTDTTGRNSQWSLPHEFTCGDPDNAADLLNYLRITEVMYNPPFGGYEFVELYNSSATVTLDLAGVKFTQGIDYAFPPGTTLAPGAYLLVVGTSDAAGFRSYYSLDGTVAIYGPYSGSLNNGGEQLVLRTSTGGTDIVNFNYGDGRGWPLTADGTGHSIVSLDSAIAEQASGSSEYAGNWRPSTYLKGSPGRADPVSPVTVQLNEIVAHTDFLNEFDSNDWIELFNPTDSPIMLGPGWYLSDDASGYTNLMKWAIPANTIIPAHGWISFDEVTGFHNPTNTGFGLGKAGEQVLLSYLPGSPQDRIVDAVSFKGQENDWSLGRYPDGAPFWYGLTPRTRNAANSAPPPRVVISELMYHPPDIDGTNDNSLDEFIEIYNGTGSAVALQNTNGTWRLNGGVDFTFPTNLTLAAGEYLLVANFNPATNAAQLAACKSLYGITDPNLRILGPYTGKLANNSDRIALERPQHPDTTNDTLNWVIVDEVLYADQSPWPCGSDGTGNSLQRLSPISHASDPLNWSAEPPTAGRPRANLPAGLPAITAQPQDRVAPTNGAASFSASVCGTPPFTYQWQFNGSNLSGATNATLNLASLTLGNAGAYRVVVSNPAGSVTSQVAMLIVQLPPFITSQPQPATTIRDQGASFSVTASGTLPISYQWRFNDANIVGATNNVLLLTNVQASQAGNYSVLVFNTAGSALSANVALTVQIPATITQQPTNRTVTLATNGPTSTIFSVTAIGTGTLRYQWRFNGIEITGATNSLYLLQNIRESDQGDYSVVVTDNLGPTVSQNARLTVLVTPVIVIGPLSQSVVQGGTVTFSVLVSGSPMPFTNEWRKASTPLFTNVDSGPMGFFTLTNVQTSAAGNYRVVVRNQAYPSPGVPSGFAALTVLPDTDGDGIPDTWESSYNFDPFSNTDRNADPDGDGSKNWEEYIAGTDPTNALSCLKVENFSMSGASTQQVNLEFNALSNRTYTILSRGTPVGGVWTRVADVVADSSNRVIEITDPRPTNGPPRFYRVVTPRAP